MSIGENPSYVTRIRIEPGPPLSRTGTKIVITQHATAPKGSTRATRLRLRPRAVVSGVLSCLPALSITTILCSIHVTGVPAMFQIRHVFQIRLVAQSDP